MSIGERIRAVRKNLPKPTSQTEFGKILGLTRAQIKTYELDVVAVPESIIRLICREFGVSYEWLTDGFEPMYVPRESLDMAALERIMSGDNEYVKSVFRELAAMPPEWWAQTVQLLRRMTDVGNEKGR